MPLFLDPRTFWTVPSAAVAVLYSAARHPTFSSSSHLIAGCCGCEEGRVSDSEMCHFAESKAVSGARSAVQVQANGMPPAHLILLTMGINWHLSSTVYDECVLYICIIKVAEKRPKPT